jgi:hypothetical protein
MGVLTETESPSAETAARTPQFAAPTRAQLSPAPAGSAARGVRLLGFEHIAIIALVFG